MRRLKQFIDILPQEPKDNKGNIVFTSLEEWAMLLFPPAVPKTLEKAMSEDSETKQRFEQTMTKTCDNNYVCIFTTKDYSGYGGQKAITNQPQQQETTVNFRDQEPHELHYALVKNFLILKKNTDKIIQKKKPTKVDHQLHQSTNIAISAYIALVNKQILAVKEYTADINDLRDYEKILKLDHQTESDTDSG